MNRFDHRSQKTFKMDVKFGTQLETYFFNNWLNVVEKLGIMKVTDYKNNGCDNSGEFIASGNTAGADYRISGYTIGTNLNIDNEPLEVKWVPTAGKFTLKVNDVRAYIQEQASILFIYNTVKDDVDLKKPKDYNLDSLIQRIRSKAKDIKWGILWSQNLVRLYRHALDNNMVKPISYMGGKKGFVIKQSDFGKWWNEYDWSI